MNRHLRISNKKIILIEDILVITNIIIMIALSILAGTVSGLEEWFRCILLLIALVPTFVSIFVAFILESLIGYYYCEECGHENLPSLKRIIFAPHVGRTRYLKCDKCNKKSWQKKIIE